MAITVDLLEAETTHIEESKATSMSSKPRLALPEKFKDHTKWRAFRDLFTNYLYSIRGARNVPLSYVIRSNVLPLEIDDPIFTTPHQGDMWKMDNAEVFNLLERLVLGGPGEGYVKTYARTRDGRKAFLELNGIYDGATVIATKKQCCLEDYQQY
jgi:hypothetical protein